MPRGVYKHEKGIKSQHYKHGQTGTRLYRIWSNMKTRCFNPNTNRHHIYLDRGISICDEWKHDFNTFYEWSMCNGYTDELTLDRKNNYLGYSPDNCRWVSYRTQSLNKRNVPVYEYKGVCFYQADVPTLFGIKRTTFQARLRRGWSIDEAINRKVVNEKSDLKKSTNKR